MATASIEIDVDLPEGVTFRGYERHGEGHAFEVDWDWPEQCRCRKCGHEEPPRVSMKNDVMVVRDLDLFGQPSFWVYQVPMHTCSRCRQREQLRPPFKRYDMSYTDRFEEYVVRCLIGSTVEDVARRLSISAETVERIVEGQLIEEKQIPADRVITDVGLDELSLKKRHRLYVTILTDLSDPEHPRVLAVAKGRDREGAEACLARLSPEQRHGILAHRTDMCGTYPTVCREQLQNSKLVIDRFHVAKRLGEVVDGLRKKHANIS